MKEVENCLILYWLLICNKLDLQSDHYDYSEDSYSTTIRGNARDDYGDNNEPYSF